MPNIKVHRRMVALTVGAVLALMPLGSYAQTTDHAAAELAKAAAKGKPAPTPSAEVLALEACS